MKYSIVIATYNRAADLRETLQSLAGLHADGPWEVIVVDNNSPDDTRQVVARRRAVVSRCRCAISSSVNRAAARRSTAASGRAAGEIVVTTDDDVRVPADWLNQAARGTRAPASATTSAAACCRSGAVRGRPGCPTAAASSGR